MAQIRMTPVRHIDVAINNTARNATAVAEDESNGHGWISIAAASAILFIGVGYTNTFGVFADYYETHLLPEEPADKIIVIGSVAASLYFILGAFTGRVADVLGYRISLSVGAGLMTGAMFAASVSKDFYQLFLSQGLMFGLGLAFVYPPATSVSRQYFRRRHGVANGIVVSGGALGGCVLPYSVRHLITSYGLSETFRILGWISLGVTFPSIALLRPRYKRQDMTGARILDLSLLSDVRFLGLLVSAAIAMTGFLPRYFLVTSSAISKGIDPTYASWLLGLMSGLSIIGRIGIGYVADRFGKVQALSLSFTICGLCHFAFWLPAVTTSAEVQATALFTLFVVFVGIFGAGFISLFPVVVADLFGTSELASKTGLLNTSIGFTVLAGPSLVNAIIGDGTHKRWMIGVLVSGIFMSVGGFTLAASSYATRKISRDRETEV